MNIPVRAKDLRLGEYAQASRLVRFEITSFYRRWGAAARAHEYEDLMQIGLIACIQYDGSDAQKRVAVRRDFLDLIRASCGIRRTKNKDAKVCWRTFCGYTPLAPIRGHERLSDVESAVHLERLLTSFGHSAPRAMQAAEQYAWTGNADVVGERLAMRRNNVHSHLHHFRQAILRP